jgi:hypothetical protein
MRHDPDTGATASGIPLYDPINPGRGITGHRHGGRPMKRHTPPEAPTLPRPPDDCDEAWWACLTHQVVIRVGDECPICHRTHDDG